MAEISRDPLGYKTKKITLLITSILGITLIGAIIWGGMIFNTYRESGGVPEMASAPAQVSISNPQNGAQIEIGESVIVEAMALGPNPILSIELWLDGELAGVQAAPSGGMHPFGTYFSWMPVGPGLHSLIVAAVDELGDKTMSAQVVVMVGENEDGIMLDPPGDVPEVLPAPPAGYAPPAGPGGGAVWPAGEWSGTVGDWATSLNEDQKPAAPELVVEAGICMAELQIHDLSNNEEGFEVYRQMINSPSWLKVATLSSQSNVEWISYQDQGVFGAATYYVAAFNAQGEAESNLALVNIDPEGCDEDGGGISATEVDLTLQIPDSGAEQVYCYQSTDGVYWARWPHFGFLTPNEEGFLPKGVLQVQRKNELSQGLFMECWGWSGGVLVPLGSFSQKELQPDLSGKQMIIGEGLAAEVALKPLKILGLGDLYPVGGEPMPDWQLDPLDVSLQKLTPIAPDIPRLNLSLTTDREICAKSLPPDAQNFLGALLYCFPYPEYDLDKGGIMPQPYLVWSHTPNPKCIGGATEECKTYHYFLYEAEGNGGQVGFDVMAISSKGKHTWTVTEPRLQMFVAPPITCVGDMEYMVRMWYQPGNKGVSVSASPDDQVTEVGDFKPLPPNEIFYGPYSNMVSVPCLPLEINIGGHLTTKRQYLDVTFETLELFEVDDGDNDSTGGDYAETVNVYGYFGVVAPSMGQLKKPHCFLDDIPGACDDSPSNPFDDPYIAYRRRMVLINGWGTEWQESCGGCIAKYAGSGTYSERCGGCNLLLNSDSYELQEWFLCQSTNKYSCLYEGQNTAYMTHNNTIRVFVTDGDSLKFGLSMVDYDNLSADDVVCDETEFISSKTLEQWAQVKDEVYVLKSNDEGSGWCRVTVTVNAVTP